MKYIPSFIEKNHDRGIYQGDFRCTVLFVDISGFTRLTETAFALGERGAEFMSRQLRRLFDEPVNAVVARNGIITNFAGDAFTALFPDDDGQQAFSAAGDVIRFFAENGRQETPDGIFDFNARCGIATGEVMWGIPRDSLGRCGYYFLGEPILEAAALAAHCTPGQVMGSDAIPAVSRTHSPSPFRGDARAVAALSPPNRRETLAAFVQDEVVTLGGKPEIRPVTSVFMSFGQSASQEMRPGAEGHLEIGRLLSVVRDEAISGGGTFNKLDFGDKGMTALCFFGAPKAPDKPIVAALRFVERLRARLRSELPEIRACIGVDAGLAYCGVTGGELRNEWTCLGNCVNTAARLMSLARWNETAVSSRVKEDASRLFDFFPLGRHALKGKSGLETVFSCRRHTGHATAFVYERPMFGRQAELSRLHEIAGTRSAAPSHRGFAGMVYVFGEAGMGKTRLVQEFRRQLEESDLPWHWIHLQCLENDPGLKPLSVWLERFFDVAALSSQEDKRRKIETKIDALVRRATTSEEQRKELRRAVSFVGALVECYWEGSLYSETADPKLRYDNQLHAVKELIKALAFQSPLILEIEDAHLIDPSTADWLKLMTRNVKDTPFLVVLTSRYRDDGSKPRVQVDDEVPVKEIELRGIDENLVTSMFVEALSKEQLSRERDVVSASPPYQRGIQGVVEPPRHIGALNFRPASALIGFLMERTGGNPFFAEQMILHLRDNRLLAEGPDGMALAGDMGRLPATLDSLLLARLDRLELNLREGLKHAAVLGVRFLKKVLEGLLRGSREFAGVVETVVPSGEKEGMVFAGTAAQGEAGLEGGGTSATQRIADVALPETAETAYLFRHALMQKAAYHLQLPSVRAYLHELAAGIIEDMFVKTDEPSGPARATNRDVSPDRGSEFYRDLAEHYGKAGLVEKEIDYLEKAAAYAAGNYKNQEAVELYARLIERLECSKLQTPGSKLRTARAMYCQARVYDLVGKWKEAIERHQQGLALAQASLECGGDAAALEGENAAVTLQKAELVVDAQAALAAMYRQRGRMKEAMEMSDSATAFAERAGYASVKATAVSNMGLAYKAHGDYARAMECHQKHLQLAEEIGDKAGKARAIGNLGTIHLSQDDFGRAMKCYEEQLRLAEELGDKIGKAAVICNMGIMFRQQGDYARAMEYYQKHLQLAEELGDKAGKATVIGNMGIVCRLQDDYPRAMEYYRRHLQLAEELGDKAGKARTTGNMGNVYFDQGDYTNAMECYQKHLQLAEELGSKEYAAFALAGIGKVSVKTGQYENACVRLEAALKIWEELKSRQGTTRSLIALAEAYLGRMRNGSRGLQPAQPEGGAEREGHQDAVGSGDLGIRRSGDQEIRASGEKEKRGPSQTDSSGKTDWKEKAREALKKARALAGEFKQTHWLAEIEKLEKMAWES